MNSNNTAFLRFKYKKKKKHNKLIISHKKDKKNTGIIQIDVYMMYI